MPELPQRFGGIAKTIGTIDGGTSTAATTLTAAASYVRGTAVEIIAATEFDANWLLISSATQNNSPIRVDIMVGAATAQIVIPDIFFIHRASGGGGHPYLFPIYIPKGSRISAQCSGPNSSATTDIAVTLFGGSPMGLGGAPAGVVSHYGSITALLGVNIDPGASANTDSAWTEITAATDRDHSWLTFAARLGDNVISANTQYRVSIGIGAATETVLINDLQFATDGTTDNAFNAVQSFPIFVPKGSRLAVKVRASVTTDGDRDIWCNLYGAG